MKKIFLFLLVVACCICLYTACSPTETPNDDIPTPTPETSVIVSVYDGDMNLIDKYTYSQSEGNTIDVSSFNKVGYKFEGIYDISGEIMLFNAKGTQSPLVMLDKNFTAVLKYSPISYQMVFEAEEGKLENTAEYIRKISYDEAVELFPSVINDGKILDGWFDENGTRYSFGTSPIHTKFTEDGFSLTQETIKLYAHYTDKYYTVSLLYQNGSNDVQIQVKHGDKLPDLTEYLRDDGSRAVIGFGVSNSTTEVFDQAIYTDLELYALWCDYKNVYFYYGEDDTRVVKIFRDGAMATLPDGELDGYIFGGWYTNELLTGNKVTNVSFGSLATMYYAKWSIAQYTISFVADGKLVSSSKFSIEEADIFVPPVPAKDHYSGVWENYELQYKNMTVNAVYTPDSVKLTLKSDGDYNYQTVVYGENYSLSVPRKKGYDFDGWFYKDQRVTDANGNSLAPYTFDGSVTFTAKFLSTKCTLFFESNGGTAIDSVEVDYAIPYTITEEPTREGFFFGGWFDETLVNEYIGTITLTNNAIIYAKWIKSTEIYDIDSLKAIADNPYGNYHLTTNINLRGEVWTPIETFTGILNGNGYKIYNFSLKKDNADLGFIIKNQGTIKNLTLTNIELSSVIEGNYTCSVSAFCSYNEGKLANVSLSNVNMIVSVKNSSVSNTVSVGSLVGENSGKVISCVAKSSLILNIDVRLDSGNDKDGSVFLIGGICGKNISEVSAVKSIFNINVNEYVRAAYTEYWRYGYRKSSLYIGGISGYECGVLSKSNANMTCNLYSNADGNGGTTARFTYIGGIAGQVDESASIYNCYSCGSADLSRVGSSAESDEFYSGGIVGKLTSGTVNNCASKLNLTLVEGHGGYMSGIVGYISKNGRVSNVAYYGEIKTTAYSGGYFTGIAGYIDGVLTKAYFHGKVDTDSANAADIVAKISSFGSVSKTIDNGNMHVVLVENNGAANDNYVIGIDYGADVLLDVNTMFEELCLFEADIWSVDEETGLYLIAFPEQNLPELE